MNQIATVEPETFVAGDSVEWKIYLGEYKASDGWVLSYALRGASNIDLTATASGDDHLISIAAATSANYAAGTYRWASFVTKGTERRTIAQGYLTIDPDLSAASSISDRMLTLEANVAAIDAFLSKNYKYASYSIAGRSLSNYSVTDLFVLRDRLNADLQRLRRAEKIRRGMKTNNLIYTRFN